MSDGPAPEVPVVAELGPLDDMEDIDPEWLWVLVRRGARYVLVPIDRRLLPATAPHGPYRVLLADVVQAHVRHQEAHPESLENAVQPDGRYTLADKERPVERITVGHFKPALTPGGRHVELAEFLLHDAAM